MPTAKKPIAKKPGTRKKKVTGAKTATPLTPPPGSRDYIDPMGGVPEHYSTESIAARQAAAAAAGRAPSGVKVIADQWEGEIAEGNPFEETARPFVEGNPDKHFRYLGDKQTRNRGDRGYVPAYDEGKPVTVSGMRLGYISKDAHNTRARQVVERSNEAIRAAKEEYQEAEDRAVRDSEGAFIPYRPGQVDGGMAYGVSARRGSRVIQ